MTTDQQSLHPSLKETAISFLNLIVSGKIREAYERYVGADFSHHNPFFRSDAESLMLAMEENEVQNPHKIFEVKLAIQEGEMVTVYSHVRQNPDDLGAAVVHIFRFKDDKVVELWDIGQLIPENSPNENGMF
ncbi:nuclear transport factor 2 family protein [Fredinandcohnia sp. QZ13]|uniref:nuclear transport factor 2 family protein n=1 Tax=Fredinandcohnia sp. QZ13 TaxID=3073144 RepID=UPI0028531333|nr:nuclear transport factor 2 family protein [Fredinandcohnia sp. QZ13]MDR4888565.1 nuclear transport factor 2 family protein [Fredinandcohnia sp. QZ13]